MSSDIIEARKNLSALASFTRGLLKLDDSLQAVGDIDKMIAARKADVAASEAILGGLVDKRSELQAQLDSLADQAKASQAQISQAAHEAATIIDGAKANAADIVAKAEANAAAAADEAALKARTVIAEATADVALIQSAAVDAGKKRDAANAEADAAEARVAAANAELARLRTVFGSPAA